MTTTNLPSGEATSVEARSGRLEIWVATWLRTASWLTAVLLAIGVALDTAHVGFGPLDATRFSRAGIFVLLLTPVVRIVLAGVIYAINRERTKAVLSLLALLIIALSFWLGHGGG